MSRGKRLYDDEPIKMLTLNEAGISGSNFARKIRRFKAALNIFIRNSDYYGSKNCTGRLKYLTVRQSTQMQKPSCRQKMLFTQIQE